MNENHYSLYMYRRGAEEKCSTRKTQEMNDEQ